ncbi:CAMK protein kinase [Aphanomyces astaci]|uniref:CAMK protein kinase n=3 Tax=Aphanomyces astaci TaxID=112090 RepID=W4GF33_APHAT|nr:CAMK protein kinase, variant 1 [Aphanomyces astaci]XP_009831868.1 CAMK protein kinase [Aphanomyces astaci]ETV78285.1 CAMK protein kinase [Aphanomyces astaci]ETV78286.1 CAMK protein kinase, variant 1 [Aphanomyces astaci]|eukprot:XP_009831867.1 CAMK protein kinase, variant 1 [Aphanomyces astaci]
MRTWGTKCRSTAWRRTPATRQHLSPCTKASSKKSLLHILSTTSRRRSCRPSPRHCRRGAQTCGSCHLSKNSRPTCPCNACASAAPPAASIAGTTTWKPTGTCTCGRPRRRSGSAGTWCCFETRWSSTETKMHTRPMGFANVSEAEMALEDDGMLTLAVTASALRTQEWAVSSWKFDDPTGDGRRWLDALTRASRLQWTDFYTEDIGVELGQGRFSVVKRARRKVPSACVAECALKIIDKAVFWKLVEQGIERNDTLFREVLTQTVLTMRSDVMHECFVVQVISLFETHDHLVIEMELMHGGDVFDRIADKGPMSEHEAAIFISHLIQGIDFCFNNGVVHRDVKLSNLALDEGTEIGASRRSPVLKLADFGMAAFLLPNGMLRGRCGTPGYVAPEILLAGVNEAYPPHVDMFSAGVVLYTLLCGYEPFFGRNDKELIALNKAVVYSFHPQEWAHISDHAKELIQLMMQPDARGRITAQEALRHPFLKDIPVASFAGAMACARLF